ncbi:hypothetical protein [Pseudonocardia lacus]|uniref:hypothetical protein n=1 Tax=Pseudonocardia lacus TaxID=2835865 RepID=UPI001BDDB086|nr:hypothetical protein [Pseudonocardia lacus]
MSNDPDHVRATCITVAAEFVAAQPDGTRRTLRQHRRLDDGNCAGCLTRPTPWPCTAAVIAHTARRLEPRST